jgi:hypothetical protein
VVGADLRVAVPGDNVDEIAVRLDPEQLADLD